MILTVSSSEASKSWTTRVAIDLRLRRWTAQAGDASWRKVTLSAGGAIDLGSGLTLKDTRERPVLSLDGAPRFEGDSSRTGGKGRLVDAVDEAFSGLALEWTQQALTDVDGLSDVRRKGMELIAINLPPNGLLDAPNCVEGQARTGYAANADGGRSTGCGGLAGWYFKQLLNAGFAVPETRVRKTFWWTPPGKTERVQATQDLVLTGPTFGHHIIVKELQKARRLPVYVDFRRGAERRPQRGDVYFIRKPNGLTRHVGIYVGADEKGWRTADGGQGASGFAVGINTRRFDPGSGAISGGIEVGYVDGWIDLDQLLELGRPES
ncbi:MAG: hypothetical protein U1F56_22480 [Rubrivivax sp.]